jgi:hypothetical protein
MVEVMHLYLDDSGTRNLNHTPATLPAHGYDWFALGGVLLKQEEETIVRQQHLEFMERWKLDPDVVFLHSADIRNKTGDFTWLAALQSAERAKFIDDLYGLMRNPPLLGFGCVIDRRGYDVRYRALYGRDQWSLCKTAFSVVVERAAKHARAKGCKLKVFVERSDRIVDGWMKGYYEHLRENGMPFATANMQPYGPLTSAELKDTLYEFRVKAKTSPIMQIADLYVWPISIGGYHKSNTTYARLMQDRKIIDCHLQPAEVATLGIKYSCWESVTVKP